MAPLHDTFAQQWALMTGGPDFNLSVMIIAATMVVLMTASQFITQLQIVSKNMSPETKASPMFRQQRSCCTCCPSSSPSPVWPSRSA